MRPGRWLTKLGRDRRGIAAIEFAVLLPILALLSIGAFDIASLVTRRIELQQAAAETASLALASRSAITNNSALRAAAAAAAGVPVEQVTISERLVCGTVVQSDPGDICAVNVERARYLDISISDDYTPLLRDMGLRDSVSMTIARSVRIQ